MAALADVCEFPHRRHSLGHVAKVLANSEADLGDDDACLDVLVAHGILPWNFAGHWMDTKIEAHNIRTLRAMIRSSFPGFEVVAEGGGLESLSASNVHRWPTNKMQNREIPAGGEAL